MFFVFICLTLYPQTKAVDRRGVWLTFCLTNDFLIDFIQSQDARWHKASSWENAYGQKWQHLPMPWRHQTRMPCDILAILPSFYAQVATEFFVVRTWECPQNGLPKSPKIIPLVRKSSLNQISLFGRTLFMDNLDLSPHWIEHWLMVWRFGCWFAGAGN